MKDCHPNNPDLVPPAEWTLHRGLRAKHVNGEFAVVILTLHDYEWAAVFDDGDADARIYAVGYADAGEVWQPTADGVGMFFWDLTQTGLAWHQDTKFEGGKAVDRSDIGLTLRP